MNNDFTIAMDMAQELMDGGLSFWEAMAQGLNESGTVDRWNREKAERKAGRRPCRYDRSAIMRRAWKYRKGEGLTMSAALKRAWADARRSDLHRVA
jgi:Ni/Co efflux regulator RcnB